MDKNEECYESLWQKQMIYRNLSSVIDKLTQLGIPIKDENGEFRSLEEILDNINQVMNNNKEGE